jgi:hypothetical protein
MHSGTPELADVLVCTKARGVPPLDDDGLSIAA